MPDKSSFDLKKSIAGWRKQLGDSGIRSSEILDELESHLCEEFEKQTREGMPEARAFEIAVERVGPAKPLVGEFAKLSSKAPSSLLKLFRYACFFSAPFMFLVGAWSLWESEIALGGRLIGSFAIAAVAAYVGALPFCYRSLPDLGGLRVRITLKIMNLVFCGWTILALLDALQVIHTHFNNLFTMICWGLYAAYALTVFALVCRGLSPRTGSGELLHPALEDFTKLSQEAIVAAREEAICLGHDYIGTEHILLGVLRTESSLLMDVFRKALLDCESVRRAVEEKVPRGTCSSPSGIPYTPRAKQVLGFAANEARDTRHSSITVEHLFLGLLLEPEGVAGMVLRNLGFDFLDTRTQIRDGLGSDGDDSGQPVMA